MAKIYVGDTGLVITANVGESTIGATATSFVVKKPDGTTATWTAAVKDDFNITYTTVAGDLSVAGQYKVQAQVSWGVSSTHLGETFIIPVTEPYK